MIITGEITTYDVPDNARDVSAAFNLIAMPHTPLLNKVPLGNSCENVKHEWYDDKRLPIATTLGAAFTSGGASLTVASSAGLRIGSIVQVGTSVYRVTGITDSTHVAVTAIASDANHDSGVKVSFLGNARTENSAKQDGDSAQTEERYNVTQIFDDFVEMSGSEMATKKHAPEASDLPGQVRKKLERAYYQLAMALCKNPRVAPSTKADPRIMGGVEWFIAQNGYVPSSAAFSTDNFDAFLLELQNNGLDVFEIWINPTDMARFSGLDSTKIQIQWGSKERGTPIVEKYFSKHGIICDVFMDPCMTAGKIDVFKSADIEVKSLAGRQFQVKNMPETTDGTVKRLLGEYTARFTNSSLWGRFTPSA
ncbi:MAG: hypothetical protein CVV44_20325 [Spirochaetae bacterium HGW-Spirochaetae-1]|jgi:hypothetical protein|nr:MAG: hypothetical protein CVV44_20325 [Spirochaetae bacterium HGW-Spirochaetae-1]